MNKTVESTKTVKRKIKSLAESKTKSKMSLRTSFKNGQRGGWPNVHHVSSVTICHLMNKLLRLRQETGAKHEEDR